MFGMIFYWVFIFVMLYDNNIIVTHDDRYGILTMCQWNVKYLPFSFLALVGLYTLCYALPPPPSVIHVKQIVHIIQMLCTSWFHCFVCHHHFMVTKTRASSVQKLNLFFFFVLFFLLRRCCTFFVTCSNL